MDGKKKRPGPPFKKPSERRSLIRYYRVRELTFKKLKAEAKRQGKAPGSMVGDWVELTFGKGA